MAEEIDDDEFIPDSNDESDSLDDYINPFTKKSKQNIGLVSKSVSSTLYLPTPSTSSPLSSPIPVISKNLESSSQNELKSVQVEEYPVIFPFPPFLSF